MTEELQTKNRFQVTDGIQVEIQCCCESGSAELSASLLDISRGGLRMSVAERLQPGDVVSLSISVGTDKSLECRAAVCWAEIGVHGWVVGCAFYEKIDEAYLEGLAAIGIVERRNDERRLVDIEAEARTELEAVNVAVEIVDISRGGFSLRAKSLSANEGDRVKLVSFAGATADVRSKVAWKRESEGGTLIGCTFLSMDDYVEAHFADNRNEQDERTSNPAQVDFMDDGGSIRSAPRVCIVLLALVGRGLDQYRMLEPPAVNGGRRIQLPQATAGVVSRLEPAPT